MSASTTVVSIRTVRDRMSFIFLALSRSARLSSSTTSGPTRRVILTRVVGWGTGSDRPMRQNRRQAMESATSLTSVS
jgi:hypothetical protein